MSRNARIGALAAVLALAVTALFYSHSSSESDPWADALTQLEATADPNAGEGKKSAKPAGAPGSSIDKTSVLEGVPTVIGSVAQPTRPELVPERIAFLPFAHRQKRVARAFGHAYHTSLAAYAAMVLERDVVDPELAVTVVRRLGNTHWWALPNKFEYSEETLRKAAKRLGAGAVVFGVMHPDGRVTMDALAIAEGVDVSAWKDFEVAAPQDTPVDVAFWNGPRTLLEKLIEAGRLPDIDGFDSDRETDAKHTAAIREAMALFWTGDLANMRRAETILAQVAVADRGRAEALVELAFVRAVRPMLFEHEAFSGILREGANAARNLAWLHDDLTPAHRQRLRFVDHLYVGHAMSDRAFDQFVASFSPSASERTLLAVLYQNRSRASVESRDAEVPGDLGWALQHVAAGTGRDERRAIATNVISTDTSSKVFETPLLIEIMQQRAIGRGDWNDRRIWAMSKVPFAAREAMETLRSTCQLLDESHWEACIGPVHGMLGEYADEVPSARDMVADDEAWEIALEAGTAYWASFALPDSPMHALPKKDVLQQDPMFAAQWYFISRLIGVSRETLSVREEILGASRGAAELLTGSARNRLHHALEWMFDSAYQRAWVGKERAQADEYQPYFELLDPISRENPFAMWKRTYFIRDQGKNVHKNLSRVHLVSYDPFDPRFIGSHRRPDGKASAYNANWLGAVVPMPNDTLARVADDWIRAGEYTRARELLEERYRTHTNDHIALELDDALDELRATPEERLAVAERALRKFPGRLQVKMVAANRMADGRRYTDAKRLYAELKEFPSYFRTACLASGRIAVLEKRIHELEPMLVDCAKNAPDKWGARALWSKVGEIRSDRDDFEGALEAYGMARRAVGGAGDVLSGMAWNHALLGNEEAAREWYDKLIRVYDTDVKSSGRRELVVHLLGRAQAKQALEILEGILDERDYPYKDEAQLLLATHLALGRFDDFRKTCDQLDSDYCSYWLGVGYWEALRDRDAALKHLSKFRKNYPYDVYAMVEEGRVRFESGDLEGAKQVVEEALELEPDYKVVSHLATQVWIASGELDRAREFASERLRRFPASIASWEARARVAMANGDLAKARRAIQNASKRLYPWDTYETERYWYDIQSLWLLEAELVGKVGSREDDLLLAKNLKRAAIRTVIYGDVWNALARVRRHLGDEEGAQRAQEYAYRMEPGLALAGHSLPAAIE